MTTLQDAHELISTGDLETAKAALDRALTEPGTDPFQYYSVYGGWYMRQHAWEQGLKLHDLAVQVRPLSLEGHFNRGHCLRELGRFEEAGDAYRRATTVDMNYPKAWMNLAHCHLVQWRLPEALACYERALALAPDDAELHMTYGSVLQTAGDDAAAIREYRHAIELWPSGDPWLAEQHLGFVLLRAGQWSEGWKHFEARHKMRPFGAPWDYHPPTRWVGQPQEFEGKAVFLRCEQGYGDCLHFVRYVPLVVKRAARVYLEYLPGLERLFDGMGARLVPRGAAPAVDIDTTLMSLPATFGTLPDYCPPPARFRVKARDVGAKVGLCWAGGARPHDPLAHADDQRRSVDPALFASVTAIAPCVSLQETDLRAWGVKDWADTAAIIKGLQLVITVDTAIAHLAGSLGIETWTLLRTGGCWRWGSVGERTPWYPSMKLYRQELINEWGVTMARVTKDLTTWASKHAPPT